MTVPSIPRLSNRASTHLDMIRGMASVLVLSNHVRNLFFINFPDLDHKSAGSAIIYALSGLGHQCVMVFFVLSGYFVSATVLKYRSLEYWPARSYAINRLVRLYTVLVPALILTALCDFTARHLPFGDHYFNHTVLNFGTTPFASEERIPQFIGSLFFLQTIVTQPFGSNGVLWTLANEFWYYAIWPLVFAVIAAKSARTRWIAGAAAAVMLVILPRKMSERFVIWLLGAVVVLAAPYAGRLSKAFESRSISWVAALGVLFAALLARKFWDSFEFPLDLFEGCAFTLLLTAIVYSPRNRPPGRIYAYIAHGLASFSFSLYAIHFPILLLARTAWGASGLWRPDAMHLAWGAVLCGGVMAIAWGFARVTEGQTDRIRRFVGGRADSAVEGWRGRTASASKAMSASAGGSSY